MPAGAPRRPRPAMGMPRSLLYKAEPPAPAVPPLPPPPPACPAEPPPAPPSRCGPPGTPAPARAPGRATEGGCGARGRGDPARPPLEGRGARTPALPGATPQGVSWGAGEGCQDPCGPGGRNPTASLGGGGAAVDTCQGQDTGALGATSPPLSLRGWAVGYRPGCPDSLLCLFPSVSAISLSAAAPVRW